jgi:hypothetical protein
LTSGGEQDDTHPNASFQAFTDITSDIDRPLLEDDRPLEIGAKNRRFSVVEVEVDSPPPVPC